MKRIVYLVAVVIGVSMFISCGSSKKLAKSPIETYNMPCVEYTTGEGALRAWASGKSDNQMVARKKAQMDAAAQLAAMLNQAVEYTSKNLAAGMNESDAGIAKSFMNESVQIVVKQNLQGAVIVCDKWDKDPATGQYTNYMVMELRGETYLDTLYSQMDKKGNNSIDRKELHRLFMQFIRENGNKK